MIDSEIASLAGRVKALVVDIDGVMTDGRIVHSMHGDELKFFDVQDGFGMALLRNAGIETFIITAKKSRIVKIRASELKVRKVYQGFPNKLKAFRKILDRFKLTAEEICFIGDDIMDIPVLKVVGFSVAVPNAVE